MIIRTITIIWSLDQQQLFVGQYSATNTLTKLWVGIKFYSSPQQIQFLPGILENMIYTMMWTLFVPWLVVAHDLLEYRCMDGLPGSSPGSEGRSRDEK